MHDQYLYTDKVYTCYFKSTKTGTLIKREAKLDEYELTSDSPISMPALIIGNAELTQAPLFNLLDLSETMVRNEHVLVSNSPIAMPALTIGDTTLTQGQLKLLLALLSEE